jgi:hypothetical protein
VSLLICYVETPSKLQEEAGEGSRCQEGQVSEELVRRRKQPKGKIASIDKL